MPTIWHGSCYASFNSAVARYLFSGMSNYWTCPVLRPWTCPIIGQAQRFLVEASNGAAEQADLFSGCSGAAGRRGPAVPGPGRRLARNPPAYKPFLSSGHPSSGEVGRAKRGREVPRMCFSNGGGV